MNKDDRPLLNEQARAEILTPQFISGYCSNCGVPLQGEIVKLNDYLPRSNTKMPRHYCMDEDCIIEVTNHRNKVRRESNKTKDLYPIRNVSVMTLALVKAFEMELYHTAADRITPYRNVKHI